MTPRLMFFIWFMTFKKKYFELDTVATWETEMGRLTVPGQLRQNSLQDLNSTEKLDVVACVYHLSDNGKHK
jgi:hypothetical protein